ncbi:MAG: transglycosylase SLT domain-containing protein [Alphaproteobacteria bacterium]|nr:transglycosylase SLT domain-containing protein [Alphaproteobacteria bacterium]
MISAHSGRLTKAAGGLCAFLSVVLLAGCTTLPPANPDNICSIFKENRSWYRATRDAQYRWGAPKSLQMAIIRQESGFDGDAKPSRRSLLFIFPGRRLSSARGYAQAIDQTWDGYRQISGNNGAERDDFKDAANFVAWHVRETAGRNGVAVTDAYGQYLAYHEGWGGYARATYRDKPGVKAAARSVAATTLRYETQLTRCEKVKGNGKTKFLD